MSKVDLLDHFKTKPVTFTWVIDDVKCPYKDRKSSEIKLSSSNLYLHCKNHYHDYAISFTLDKFIPEIYYRISFINDKGQKCDTKEGFADRFEFEISWDYLTHNKNGLGQDGKLTVYAEFFELNTVECIQSRLNNLISLSHDNQSLLDSGKWSDVVLVVGEREFKAHKSILSSRSVVFDKMFESGLEESIRNRVDITDMSAGACEEMLKFIYSGKVPALDGVYCEHAYELFAAADKYQIDSLKSHCELYLAVTLSLSTLHKTLQLAHLYSAEELKSKCADYIHLYWEEFKFDDFKVLSTLS